MLTTSNIAKTFKAQGGQGISLTNIRPKGAKIADTFVSDGIIPFMEIFNTVTASISQGSHRRGALMCSLSVNHPQIYDFISIKDDLNKINNANLSVEIDDKFMKAVQEFYKSGKIVTYKIPNIFKGGNPEGYEITPINIYKEIIKHAWKSGEPGVMFMDRFSNYNLMEYDPNYVIYTSNPCGEQPLVKHMSCNLSSVNLSQYIDNPFTDKAFFNFDEFRNDLFSIVRAMDDLIDENYKNHPLKEQQEMNLKYRNCGIGIMGLHDALIKVGLVYGSQEAVNFTKEIMKAMFVYTLEASCDLAKERGAFPEYTHEVLKSSIINYHKKLFSDILWNNLNKYGLRNCSLLSVAPTGSIGTLLNISTGVEPWFRTSYIRVTKSLNGDKEVKYEVDAPIIAEAKKYNWHPETYVSANDIKWQDRINMQEVIQNSCDTAISSTINLPNDITLEEVELLYLYAWQHGLKGVTIFRDGCRAGILTENTEESKKENNILELKRGDIVKAGNNCIGLKRTLMTGCGSLHCEAFFDPKTGDLREIYLSKGSTGG